MSSRIPALGPICLLKELGLRLETERSKATLCRDCGEMNVYPNGGLVAHGEPHRGRMAFSRLMLQTSLCGQAYPGLPEGLDTAQ